MKLYYLANIRLPTEKAHGIQIMKMCEALADLGFEVELIAPRRLNSIKADAFSYYGVRRSFKITKLPGPDLLIWPNRFTFFLQSAVFLLAAKIYLLNKKFDVLYTREPAVGYFFKNFILELHNLPEEISSYKKLLVKAEKIIVLTGLAKAELKQALNSEKDILVAPDGVDPKEFDINLIKEQARRKLNLPLDKKIVLYAGHLYEWKGAGDLAEAAERLSGRYLVIFAGGVEADAKIFKERNKKLIDNGQMALYRHQPHNLIPVWLKSADVLILPNKSRDKISKYYTSPLKLFEYMASQRPIVASDLPSIREVLNENNCLFFQPDDFRDLADKIKLVLNNGALAEKISWQAHEDVKQYTWEKRAEKIIKFIK